MSAGRETAGGTTPPAIAFYAPMKAPDHPTPSGDRQIARLTVEALRRAGYAPRLVSRLRIIDTAGDPAAQAALHDAARAEATRLIAELGPAPPVLWFTYHCHYKAPDLVGPTVARALSIPYVVSEPSLSPRRRDGPWAGFAAVAAEAIAAADLLLWTTARDRPALEAAGHAPRMRPLPAFTDPGPAPEPRRATRARQLLTVAMMRPGDKMESFRRLAAALAHLPGDWSLRIVGDGPARAEVAALLAPFGERVALTGALDDPAALARAYRDADLFLWPGVGEGVGMVYLEAQAAGLGVVAEDHPAPRALIGAGCLTPPGDARAMADAIAGADPAALSPRARAHVEAHHSLEAAARRLATLLQDLT